MTRTGRRPGTPDTREAILAVARRGFATRGFEATSLRAIAAEAGVDPALIIHYFGSKAGLFVTATGLPADLAGLFSSVAALPPDDVPPALVRSYLQLVDSDQSRNAIIALVRSAVSNEQAAAMLREFLTAELLPVIQRVAGSRADARLRANLTGAQLIGIAMLRHVLRVEPLASATPDDIVPLVVPAIEQYLR
ncbi:MAG TPA: TetR family transcriptional regulator [Streptosporangiaceae bacterium]|jgi:AcrR family transcriptional regulator